MLKFNPLRASSYLALPAFIARKRAIVNVKNEDNFCFAWAITSSLVRPTGLPQRTTSYPDFRDLFNWTGIQFPVKISDISKFETNNIDISVNVYGLEKINKKDNWVYEVVGPLYYTQTRKNNHVNLLLIDNDRGAQHYCWIKDFSRLLCGQITQRNGVKYFCDACLCYFRTKTHLLQHTSNDCNFVYTKLPETSLKIDKLGVPCQGNILKFENYHKVMTVPFVIYADFESILSPLATVEPDSRKPFIIKTCKHEPYSFCYYIKSFENNDWSRLEIYRGRNSATVFISMLERHVQQLYDNFFKIPLPMKKLTVEEQYNFDNASSCFICGKQFEENADNPKVRDHSHITGQFRGAAHARCNLNFKLPKFIPVIMHNLSNYDCHLFIKQLATETEEIDVLPNNTEKYISFGKSILVDEVCRDGKMEKIYIRLRFIDSYRFLPFSLDFLSKELDDDQCFEVKTFFPENEKFNLLRKKGVFPYSYLDCFEKLNDVSLPSQDKFYNTMSDENITLENYQRACTVWNTFGCKTLGEYSDLYLKSDVLILADVFENFRKLCKNIYSLDPAHYVTTPGLAWDVMLKFTGVELELLTDMDMYHYFKKGIRGGVSTCVKRSSIGNNQFLPNFDPNKQNSFILYLDATNLYGHSMRAHLPYKGFAWLTEEEIENLDILDVPDEADIGYVLEVDLYYPASLHSKHNDFPFCPENIIPPNSNSRQKKLIPNLMNKSKYVIHYRNLKQCLHHGLKLTKIHRVLKFHQSPWLRNYIDLNTEQRNMTTNEFSRSFFKLMNNGVFGKTMENVDKRRNLKLLTHWENHGRKLGIENYVAKPNFKKFTQFSDKLFAVEMSKVAVTYDKPVYVGFTVLDVSKIVMYRFFYDILRVQFGENVSLLYTDTDSLILEIRTENVYDHIRTNLAEYDTSNYNENIHDIPTTPSIVGKMKDEYRGQPIHTFYGAGAKSYCVSLGDKLTKKAKGVKKCVIEKVLTDTDFKNVAECSKEVVVCKMFVFRSTLHEIYTELINKIALTSRDDKRFILPDGCNTLAWGHSQIDQYFPEQLENQENTINKNLDNLVQIAQEMVSEPICNQNDEVQQNLDNLVKLAQEMTEGVKEKNTRDKSNTSIADYTWNILDIEDYVNSTYDSILDL